MGVVANSDTNLHERGCVFPEAHIHGKHPKGLESNRNSPEIEEKLPDPVCRRTIVCGSSPLEISLYQANEYRLKPIGGFWIHPALPFAHLFRPQKSLLMATAHCKYTYCIAVLLELRGPRSRFPQLP